MTPAVVENEDKSRIVTNVIFEGDLAADLAAEAERDGRAAKHEVRFLVAEAIAGRKAKRK